MAPSEEQFAQLTSRLRICYQTFGDPKDPAVILVAGNAGSMLEWHEDLIERHLNAGNDGRKYYVIRYDHRDTGLSTEFPVPAGYSLADMASDIEGLADHLGLNEPSRGFHILGASKGGPLAYMVAANRPQQVRSLTLMYTSPGISEDLPVEEGQQLGFLPPPLGFGDMSKMHFDNRMAMYDAFTVQPNEEERKLAEELAWRVVKRDTKGGTIHSKDPNHFGASHEGDGWPGKETLAKIVCPTLVIQAGKDQCFGVKHGQALVDAIDGAEYVLWEDVGHEIPPRIWGRFGETANKFWARGDDIWADGK